MVKAKFGSHHLPVFELSILLVGFGLFIGALTRSIQKSFGIPIPYTVVVLLAGVTLAICHEYLGDLGLAIDAVQNIHPKLLLGVFIPGLIFESAFNTNFHIVMKQFGQAILLAGPGVLINAAVTAVLVKYIFPYDWDWAQCSMFGAIASATDPVAVVALLSELGASKRLATLVEAESFLNDGTAFVLYMIALEFVKGENPYVVRNIDTH